MTGWSATLLVLVSSRGREVVGGERRATGGVGVVSFGLPELVVRSVGVVDSGALPGFVAILQAFLSWILCGENVDGRMKGAKLLLFSFPDSLIDVDEDGSVFRFIGNGALGVRYGFEIRECGEGLARSGSGIGKLGGGVGVISKGETETGVGRCGGGRGGRGLFSWGLEVEFTSIPHRKWPLVVVKGPRETKDDSWF